MMMVCLAALTSCVEDMEVSAGWLSVARPEKAEETRADIDYLISIRRGGEVLMSGTPFSSLAGPIRLSATPGYTLLAESCTAAQAESEPDIYGQPRYAGTASFDIEADVQTTVKVTCSMANAAFKLVLDESFDYVSYEVKATVGTRTVTLTDAVTTAYFNVDATQQATLSYSVLATDAEGKVGTSSGTVVLKARTLSRLTLKAGSKGQVGVQVSYDDQFVPGNSVLEEI